MTDGCCQFDVAEPLAPDARQGLGTYFPFYNNDRIHQALDYRTPQDVHFSSPHEEI